MTTEIIKELTTIKDASEITSKKVLSWTIRLVVQHLQMAMLEKPEGEQGF